MESKNLALINQQPINLDRWTSSEAKLFDTIVGIYLFIYLFTYLVIFFLFFT